MNNYPMMSRSDEERAPFNEVEEKRIIHKKISVVLTKEIEVEVNADREYSDEEILKDYIDKHNDPRSLLYAYQLRLEFDKDTAIEKHIPIVESLNRDLEGVRRWETKVIEIDDV